MKVIKAMRDVRALARGDAGADAVNAYNFRSAEEIKVYLEELKKQVQDTEIPDQSVLGDAVKAVGKLFAEASVVTSRAVPVTAAEFRINRSAPINQTKVAPKRTTMDGDAVVRLDEEFNIKNTKKLESQFAVIKSLHNKLEVLDAMELTIKQAFAGERNTLGTQIAKTRKAVELKLKAALAFISKAAQKKEPKQFTDAIDPAVETLLERAKGLFKGAAVTKNYLFVKPDKQGTLFFVFQRYVILNNFRASDDSFTYPQYVIVFSAAVSNDKRMTMHVTTLHSERAPGTFKFGSTFKDQKTALRELDALLDMDNAVDLMTKTKLPTEGIEKQKFATRQYIQDVTVEDDHVRIRMSKKMPADKAKRQPIIEKVFLDLRTLLGYGKTKTLKYKVIDQADRSVVLDFVLVPQAWSQPKGSITDRQRALLETHFGFDDEDVANLIRVMNRGF